MYVLLKAIASHAMATKNIIKVIQIWQTRVCLLTFKVILLSTSKIYLAYKTLDLVDK